MWRKPIFVFVKLPAFPLYNFSRDSYIIIPPPKETKKRAVFIGRPGWISLIRVKFHFRIRFPFSYLCQPLFFKFRGNSKAFAFRPRRIGAGQNACINA